MSIKPINEQGKPNNFANEPQVYVQAVARTGLTPYAETLNGRLAMLGLITLLILEAMTGHGLFGSLAQL